MALRVQDEEVVSAQFRIAIGRSRGTVVVEVRGQLDVASANHLGSILGDLIDGQGNLAVLVDLCEARAGDADGSARFAAVADRAGWKAGQLTLRDPPPELRGALQVRGLGGLVRLAGIRPLRADRG